MVFQCFPGNRRSIGRLQVCVFLGVNDVCASISVSCLGESVLNLSDYIEGKNTISHLCRTSLQMRRVHVGQETRWSTYCGAWSTVWSILFTLWVGLQCGPSTFWVNRISTMFHIATEAATVVRRERFLLPCKLGEWQQQLTKQSLKDLKISGAFAPYTYVDKWVSFWTTNTLVQQLQKLVGLSVLFLPKPSKINYSILPWSARPPFLPLDRQRLPSRNLITLISPSLPQSLWKEKFTNS